MWAVIPVKRLEFSKQRLAGVLNATQRANLMRAMLEDVLTVLADVPGLSGRLVVTSEPGLQALAQRYGALVLNELADDCSNDYTRAGGDARQAVDTRGEPPPQGQLCHALEQAVQHLHSRGARGMLVIPGDVPLIAGAEVAQLIALHEREHLRPEGGVTIVPDHDCAGTNALLVSPPGRIEFRFGFDSCKRHEQAAAEVGLHAHVVRLPGFALDVDNAADLNELRARGVGTRAHAVLVAMNLREGIPEEGNPAKEKLATGNPVAGTVANGDKEAHAATPTS